MEHERNYAEIMEELTETTEKYGDEIWETVNSYDLSDFPSEVKTKINLEKYERLYS